MQWRKSSRKQCRVARDVTDVNEVAAEAVDTKKSGPTAGKKKWPRKRWILRSK